MLRPRRDIQIPARCRSGSPPRLQQNNNQRKRRRINLENVDRNTVDQALAVIAPAPECSNRPPVLISTELPHFNANYVENRSGRPQYTDLSESGFFGLFFSDFVVEILSKETNTYAEFKFQNPSPDFLPKCHWIPTTPAEIRVYLGINLHFGLYPLTVRRDYWRIHNLGEFIGRDRFEDIHRFFSPNLAPSSLNAPWFHRIQRVADLI
jgi:Transposase IS4